MSKKPSASKRTNFTKRKHVVDPPLYRNTFQDHDRSECSTASRKKHLKVEHKPTGLYIKSRRIKSSESNTSLNNTIDETWMESQRNFDDMVRTKERNEKENIISVTRRKDIATQIELESIKKSQERTARVSKRNALISTKGTPDFNIRLRAMAENKTCNASTQSEMQEEEVTPKVNPDEGICTFDEEPGVKPPPPPLPPLPPPEINEADLNKPPPPPNNEICTFDEEPGAKPPPPVESPPPPGPPPPGPPPPGPPPSEPSPPGPPPPAPPPPGPPPSGPSPPAPPPPAPPHPAPPPPGPPPSGPPHPSPPPPGPPHPAPPPPGPPHPPPPPSGPPSPGPPHPAPPPPGPPPPGPPHPAPPPSGPPSPGPPSPAPPPPEHPPLGSTPTQELPLKPQKPDNGRGKCVPPKRRPCCFEPRQSHAEKGSRFTVCTPQDQSKIQNFEACLQQCMNQCREQFPMCRPQANQPNFNPRDGPMNPRDRYGPNNDFGGQRIPNDHGMDPCASRKALKFCNDVDRNNYPRIGNADYGAQAQDAGRNTIQTFQYGSSWGEDLESYPYDRRSFGVEARQPYRPPGLPYQQHRDPREFDPRHELYESSTPAYSYDGRCLDSGADYGPMTPAYPHSREPTYIPRPTGREQGGVRNVDRMNPPNVCTPGSGRQYEPVDYDGDSARHRKHGKRGIKPCPKPSKELSSKSSNTKTKDVMEVLEQISGVINAAYHLYRDVVQNTAPCATQQEESVPPISYPCKGPRNAVFQLPDKINKNLESQSIWRQLETMSPSTPSKPDYHQRKSQDIKEAEKNCALSEIRYIFH